MAIAYTDSIHSTALIDPEAFIAPDVQIGPYVVIEGAVRIGPGCVIEAQACLSGPLVMGSNNFVGHAAVLGKSPQHRGYRDEPTSLEIGDDNVFREFVTIHRGTVQGNGVTTVGHRNMFMVGSHVGHDAQVGNGCTVVNNALVAGHVCLEDDCILSGHSAVQQRVRIGRLAMLAGIAATSKDIPPFILQQGYNCVTGLNIVGIRRAGFSADVDRRAPAGVPDPLSRRDAPPGRAREDRIQLRPGSRGRRVPRLHPPVQDRHQPRAIARAPELRHPLSPSPASPRAIRPARTSGTRRSPGEPAAPGVASPSRILPRRALPGACLLEGRQQLVGRDRLDVLVGVLPGPEADDRRHRQGEQDDDQAEVVPLRRRECREQECRRWIRLAHDLRPRLRPTSRDPFTA